MYWYENSVFQVGSASLLKHVKISLIVYPNDLQSLPKVKQQLTNAAETIASYWQPIKSWSPVALTLSKNGDTLIIASSSLLCLIIPIYALMKNNQVRKNRTAYKKLSEDYKLLVTAVHGAEKQGLALLDKVSTNYQQLTGNVLDKEALLRKLYEVEKLDMIKRRIASRNDEPVQVWRTQLFYL
jgi:hypothetical protein